MTPEQAAKRIAEALNGGEWRDRRWYTEGQRQAWIKAVEPVLADAMRFGVLDTAMRQATTHGTGIIRTTVDGVEQVGLEDYLSDHEKIGEGMRSAIRKNMRGVIMRSKA